MKFNSRLPMRGRWVVLLLAGSAACFPVYGEPAQEDVSDSRAPTLKFFYYDSASIEWAVSAEPDLLESHFQANADSARLFQSLSSAVHEEADLEQGRAQMARWLESERGRVSDPRGNVVRLRKAEGITAYLRAHEFRMEQLVEALMKHTGASRVEIAAVHLVDDSGTPSFYLKIMLPNETIGIGGQGINVVYQSPEISYTRVVYALAVALYEVHERINFEAEEGAESSSGVDDAELLPPPEPGALSEGHAPPIRATAVRP